MCFLEKSKDSDFKGIKVKGEKSNCRIYVFNYIINIDKKEERTDAQLEEVYFPAFITILFEIFRYMIKVYCDMCLLVPAVAMR